MSGGAVNLSLLSRGVGQVKHNGTEKIDVKLEPEDYFNYIQNEQHMYLPPLQPNFAYMNTPRGTHEVILPKTYTTRKGALLLFSEDYANKLEINQELTRQLGHGASGATTDRGPTHHNNTMDDLDLKTVDDLSRSILAYGSNAPEGVNLRFTRDSFNSQRRLRPGFSAKRYLSRLTRSFDDTFLDKLLKEGYVHEKTLFVNNALVPNLKRRINDDLSYMPAPYRIMKQMLMAPGILSGYTFYMGKAAELDELLEEESGAGEAVSEPPMDVGLVPPASDDGKEPKRVTYSDLGLAEKGQVLADFLVKSAINQALDTRNQAMSRGHLAQELSQEEIALDMEKAVQNYIDSQQELQADVPVSQKSSHAGKKGGLEVSSPRGAGSSSSSQAGSLRGQKRSGLSGRSFAVPSDTDSLEDLDQMLVTGSSESSPHSLQLRETVGEKEYSGDVPIASVRDTVSSGHSSHRRGHPQPHSAGHRSDPRSVHARSDQHIPVDFQRSKSPSLVGSEFGRGITPVLPPIRSGVTMSEPGLAIPIPDVHIEPPTPQLSSLSKQAPSRTHSSAHSRTHSPQTHMIPMSEEALISDTSDPQLSHGQRSDRSAAAHSHRSDRHRSGVDSSTRSSTGSPRSSGMERRASERPRSLDAARSSARHRSGSEAGWRSADRLHSSEVEQSDRSFDQVEGDERSPHAGRSSPGFKQSKDSSLGVPLGGGGATLSQSQLSLDLDSLPKGAVLGSGLNQVPGSDLGADRQSQRGSVVSYGSMRGRALKTSTTSVKSKPSPRGNLLALYDDAFSHRGSVVFAPDGTIVNVGGSINKEESSSDSKEARDELGELAGATGGGTYTGAEEDSMETEEEKDGTWPGSLKTSSSSSGRPKAQFNKMRDDGTGEVDESVATFTQPVNENQLMEALSQHAHKIAQSILSRPQSGVDLVKDAKNAIAHFQDTRTGLDRDVKSADPCVAEYKDMLKETLMSVLGSSSMESLPAEALRNAELSPDLIDALAHQNVQPEDIKLMTDEDGNPVLVHAPTPKQRPSLGGVKEGHIYTQPGEEGRDSPSKSIALPRESKQDLGGLDVLKYQHSDKEGVDTDAAGSDRASGKGSGKGSGMESAIGSAKGSDHGSASQKSATKLSDAEKLESDRKLSVSHVQPPILSESVKPSEDIQQDSAPKISNRRRMSKKQRGSILKRRARGTRKEGELEAHEEDMDDNAKLEALKKELGVDSSKASSRRNSRRTSRRSSMKSDKSAKSQKSVKSGDKAEIDEAMEKMKSAKSKSSVEDREEFVVGKVPDDKMSHLYAKADEPPASKEKKPRVPPARSPKKKASKKKSSRLSVDSGPSEAPTSGSPAVDSEVPQTDRSNVFTSGSEGTFKRKIPKMKFLSSTDVRPKDSLSSLFSSPPASEPDLKREESLDFVIVRDEFSDEEEEEEEVSKKKAASEDRRKSTHSVQSKKSLASSVGTRDTDGTESLLSGSSLSWLSMDSSEARGLGISQKEARAAKRAAQAEKRRQQVERKRREREEQAKKEKEDQGRQERLQRELEEDRRRKEEERRLVREQREAANLAEERQEQERERRRQQEADRDRRMKEDYQRKLEEMKKKQALEEKKRKEEEAERMKEDEIRRKSEEEMLSKMAAEEREEYERKKREAEEEKKRKEEAERIRREEEAAQALAEAKKLAEEMARKEEELKMRLQFNRAMQLDSNGLAHTQEITRAFVFSYYELLKWLGLDVPDFERWKDSLKY